MKMYQHISTILLFLTFFFTAIKCSAQPHIDDAAVSIAKSNETYFMAFEKGEASLLAAHYTKDCWIMPANTPTMCGEDAPGDFFTTAYTLGLRNGKFITIDIAGEGEDFVTETGFYHFYNATHDVMERGKYLVLWKKVPEGWKMYRNSFSPDHGLK